MLEDRAREIESVRKRWDEHTERYDEWYKTFHGAVENYVDWELLKGYLPKNKNAKILDAAGGTGRITLPLAKMGYSVTLCDISPGMLNVAKRKLRRARVLDKVKVCECDVRELRFPTRVLILSFVGMGWRKLQRSSFELQRGEEQFQFF